MDNEQPSGFEEQVKNPPIFNIPTTVLTILLVLVAIHVGREVLLTVEQDNNLLIRTAFIPVRYVSSIAGQGIGYFVSPLTYSFLHGGYGHLLVNGLWLVAFGSVVERRWGLVRFCLFWLLSSVAAAGFYMLFHWGQVSVMIGASGVISALMGAATRFAFPKGGRFIRDKAHFLPRQSFSDVFQNKNTMVYLAIWFGINLFPLLGLQSEGSVDSIAWEAHIGGFLFGFLFFGAFDHKNWQ